MKRSLSSYLENDDLVRSALCDWLQTQIVILDRGRQARNRLVHEFTIGLPHRITKWPEEEISKELGNIVRDIAEAQIRVALFMSALTGEPLPFSDYLQSYADRAVEWLWATSG